MRYAAGMPDTNKQYAIRLREMIAALQAGASPSAFGPTYIEALKAGAAALDPDEPVRPRVP